ncbi:MAG: hypothetical protein HW389_925, partial [Bacteroidetes bacterium]|nr:hypothetical protein [Bacteroidota bacterium]
MPTSLSRFLAQLRPQRHTLLHVEDVAGLGEPVDQGRGQVIVFEERAPVAEAQVGGEERRLLLVPPFHQGEEESDLDRLDLRVSDFVAHEAIDAGVAFEHPGLGVIGDRGIEFGHQVGEADEAAGVALVDRVDQKAGGEATFPTARGAKPNHVLLLVQVAEGIVERHDLLLVQLGLALEGEGLDDQGLRDARAAQPQLAGILPLDPVFLGQHM